MLKSVAATFRPWRASAASIDRMGDVRKEPAVRKAPSRRSLRHEALTAAFILVLLVIALGTVVRVW
jgi:hypothetical protein